MTVPTENVTFPKSIQSRKSSSSVRIQIRSKFQCKFVPRDTGKSEFLDLVDSRGVVISVEIAICKPPSLHELVQNICLQCYVCTYIYKPSLHELLPTNNHDANNVHMY